MKAIVIGNNKGGVGKTTLAAHLAWYAAERGHKVAVLDLDSQGNISDTLRNERRGFPAADLFSKTKIEHGPIEAGITLFPASDALSFLNNEQVGLGIAQWTDFAAPFDYVIIDTQPSISPITTFSLIAADAWIVPADLKHYAVSGLRRMMDALTKGDNFRRSKGAKPINRLGIVVCKFNTTKADERADYADLIAAYGRHVVEGFMAERVAYANASKDRLPVWKLEGRAAKVAAAEVQPILEYILTKTDEGATNGSA